jgi:nucleotide-binding universal stress UspA family protein
MYDSILVPLDGSDFAESALPVAALLARSTGARLTVVRCVWAVAPDEADPTEAQRQAVALARAYLDEIAARLAEKGVPAETAVRSAPAVEGILAQADFCRADLVVMSTHGRSAPGRWIYGSVAEGVLTKSPVPLLLTRPGSARRSLDWQRRRLVVPLDGSAYAEEALPHASALGRAVDGTVVLVHVTTPVAAGAGRAAPASDKGKPNGHAVAPSYLESAAARLAAEGVRVTTSERRAETAADGVIDEVRDSAAGIVVMATHGRTGLPRLVFGSVASEVLRRGQQPVLLVRPAALAAGIANERAARPVGPAD